MPREDEVKIGSHPLRSQVHILLSAVTRSFHRGSSPKSTVGDGCCCCCCCCFERRVAERVRVALRGVVYVGMIMVGRDMGYTDHRRQARALRANVERMLLLLLLLLW